ncbi:MAG: electron transfer flavoprotein subunit beta/FixA family protein [Planctomycetota bacterium]|jgi:electron transfer flavoprotein beta subunit
MRILTLAMPVPDSRAAITIAPDGRGIESDGVKIVCNPFDEFAVEQAIRLREQRADVEEVVVLSVGGPDATQALRTALAMGADRAIHVHDGTLPTHDEVALAGVLAAAIRHDGSRFDLILCGKQTIDNDAGELGPALAESLGLPHVGAAVTLDLADDATRLQAHRRIEGAEEVVQASLPALVTCDKGLVEPRLPSLPNLMKAKSKPTETLDAADLPAIAAISPGTRFVKASPLPERPPCRLLEGAQQEMAQELVRLLHEEMKVI